MEDSGIVFSEALIPRNHSVEKLFVQSQTGDGGEQPAVTYEQQRQTDVFLTCFSFLNCHKRPFTKVTVKHVK